MPRKKALETDIVQPVDVTSTEPGVLPVKEEQPKTEPTNAELKAQIERLEAMLRSTADAGRLMNFETQQSQGKKPVRVKLSQYAGGLIIGWRTIKDQLIQHPTTGKLVGEEQQYELMVQLPTGDIKKEIVNSYQAFSEARYGNRIEADVVGKREGYGGEMTFELMLLDGNKILLDSRFIN